MTQPTKPTIEEQIDALAEMRERFLVMVITYKVGDQFDGDFQNIEDAIASLRELQAIRNQPVPVEPQRYAWTRDGMMSVTGNGEYVPSIIFDALQQVLQAEIHKHKITKQLFEEELKDGDTLCSSLCFERTEGGRLPVRKMVADIGDVAMRLKHAESELAAIKSQPVPVEPDGSPEWIPKQYRKTTGGQIVGWKPLMCEANGGSDYCMHCGMEMVGYSDNRPPCEALERRRLAMIPDEMVLAFGCRNEAFHAENGEPTEGEACKKWCRRPACPVSFKEKP